MSHPKKNKGFTLIEIMIASLILSTLALSLTLYLKRSQSGLRESDLSDNLRTQLQSAQKFLRDDLQQVAFINPSCEENEDLPAEIETTTSCLDIPIQGSLTPYPGYSKSDLSNLEDLSLPSTLEESPDNLPKEVDAIRIVHFDFDSSFQCRLNPDREVNPSQTDNRFWAHEDCQGLLQENELYIMMQTFNNQVISNAFQITSLELVADEIVVDIDPTNNIFNQPDPLGEGGYRNSARVYPIQLVEYALDREEERLYRRTINPDSSDPLGYEDWVAVQSNIEGIQFSPVTITTNGPVEHYRTMDFDSADLHGIFQIRGVSPRVVAKSPQATHESNEYSNPLIAGGEMDSYPREEAKFFVRLRNTSLAQN